MTQEKHKETNKEQKHIAILSAMAQELINLDPLQKHGPKNCFFSVYETGVGKPAAAAKTQEVISLHNPDLIIFAGLGGAIAPGLNLGDTCVGTAVIDSDIDVRAWDASYLRGELPFSRDRVYKSDEQIVNALLSDGYIEDGFIASGSVFLAGQEKKAYCDRILPELSAIIEGKDRTPNVYDMESSAVLQVANRNNTRCVVLRTISDTLDGDCASDFNEFLRRSKHEYANWINLVAEYFINTSIKPD